MIGRPLPVTTILVLAVFVITGGIIWLAYADAGNIHGEPPLIRASAKPLKQAPDDPGGLQAEVGGIDDLLAAQPEGLAEERLMPTPEQPLSPAEAAVASLNRNGVAGGLLPDPEKRAQAAVALKDLADGLRAGDASSPNGAGGPMSSAAEMSLAAERLPSPARPPVRQPGAGQSAQKPNEPESRGNRDFSSGEVRVAGIGDAAISGNVPINGNAPHLRGTPDGRFRIQLAAVRGKDDANRAWSHFQEQLGAYIGNLEPFFEVANTDNGTFYRIQIGPFANNDEADLLCTELKKQNASCFVVSR